MDIIEGIIKFFVSIVFLIIIGIVIVFLFFFGLSLIVTATGIQNSFLAAIFTIIGFGILLAIYLFMKNR